LKQGQLVAFPTETVFGLGAIANNERAVASVYQAKGRPSDNPLIVHVCRKEDLFRYSNIVNEAQAAIAKKLTDQFWPGPLT
ncbi:L-threonylcarbamoyladenylate synthase, partial [Streptococcus anginosus]